MLDTLRSEFHYVGIAPERQLRTFALECLDGLKGTDAEPLRELIDAVTRRIDGNASLEELASVQRCAQPFVTPAGVMGLPRLVPHAAGVLAAWHTATPNPYDAAFWTAEFAALHAAFVAAREAASREQPSPAASGWQVAFFDHACPDIGRTARMQCRRELAVRLRRILPQPFLLEGAGQQRATN